MIDLTVTITKDHKKAIFEWDMSEGNCDYKAFGFDDNELDHIIGSKAFEGKQIEGYKVEIS